MTLPTALIATRTHHTLHIAPLSQSPSRRAPPPSAVEWFPSGHLLVEASPTTLLFRTAETLATAREIDVRLPDPAPILCLTISPAARFLAFGRADGRVSLLDLSSTRPMTSFTLRAPVLALDFQRSPDARYLACATPHAVSLFSRVSNRLVARYALSAAAPRSLTNSGGAHSPRRAFVPAAGPKITALAFSPAHVNLLAATDDSGCVNVWDVSRAVAPRARTEPHLVAPAELHHTTYSRFTSPMRTPAADLSFAPRGSAVSLCVGGFDKQLRFFDAALKQFLFAVACAAPVSAVSWSGDGGFVGVGMTNGAMNVVEVVGNGGKVIGEVFVDRVEGEEECTPVRSVHFQPMEVASPKGQKSALRLAHEAQTRIGKASMLAGVRRDSVGVGHRPGQGGNAGRDAVVRNHPDGMGDEDDDGLNLLDESLNSSPFAGRPTLYGKLRSESGPRDSDIFSPLASRTPHPGNFTPRPAFSKKSISFHESPRSTEPSGESLTVKTPRARTSNAVDLLKNETGEVVLQTESEETVSGSEFVDIGATDDSLKDVDETEHRDSDSLDSVTAKSPEPTTPKDGARFDVPDKDNVSDDVAVVQDLALVEELALPLEQRANSSSFSGVTSTPSPSDSSGKRYVRIRSTEGRPDRLSSAALVERQHISDEIPQFSNHGRSNGLDSTAHTRLRRKSNENRRAGGAGSFSSSVDAPCSEASSRSGAAGSDAVNRHEANFGKTMSDSEGKSAWVTALAEQLRGMMAEELDVVKTELRQDVLNIHSEMVITSANHSQELQAAFKDRDRRVKQLEAEVERLEADNDRLRRKYGLS